MSLVRHRSVPLTGKCRKELDERLFDVRCSIVDELTFCSIACDVSDKEAIAKLAAQIGERETHLDVLVSNAGIRRDPVISCNVLKAPLLKLQASMWSSRHSDWADSFSVNTTAHYFLSVAFLPLLVAASQRKLPNQRLGKEEGRGVIVITSSCASMHNATNVDLTSYATSKAATDHLVKLLAAKFGRFYIRVAGINPGCKCPRDNSYEKSRVLIDDFVVVPSKMNPVGEEGNMFSSLFDKVPAKRSGGEEDIAGTVLYLVSRAGVCRTPLNCAPFLSKSC